MRAVEIALADFHDNSRLRSQDVDWASMPVSALGLAFGFPPYVLSEARTNTMWILWVIVVGLIGGWATGKIMKGSGYGPLMDILVGIAGGIIGGWILRLLGFYPTGGLIPSILVAILGAIVLVGFVRMLKRA